MWLDILKVLCGVAAGAVLGFFICRWYMMRYFKKNPPLNEKMIEVMMTQMGRKPSHKQVQQVMQQMNRFK